MKSDKVLDKDLMFKKIMPSSQKRNEISSKTVSAEPPVIQTPSFSNEQGLHAKIFSRAQDIKPENGIPMVNLMEVMVFRHMDEVIGKFNCCRCDRCQKDIAALALNRLSPKYVAADIDRIDSLADLIPKKQVLDALIHAIIVVRSHPRH